MPAIDHAYMDLNICRGTERKAKQTSTQAAVFQREMKNIFAAARRNVRDLSDAGITLMCVLSVFFYLNLKAHRHQTVKKRVQRQSPNSELNHSTLKRMSKSSSRSTRPMMYRLSAPSRRDYNCSQDSVHALTSYHATLFDNLLPRRVEQINAASSMSTFDGPLISRYWRAKPALVVVQDPNDRDRSLKKHLRAAQASLEQAKHEEKVRAICFLVQSTKCASMPFSVRPTPTS
jgi:hypothetical protein